MSKISATWRSERLGQEIQVVRWGEVGTPVLLFPTAAGDAEECERFLMVKVLAPLLEQQKIKLYSVASIGGQAFLSGEAKPREAARVQNQFDACLYHEVVPAIRSDCQSGEIEVVVAGASIGAFNALAAICRHPDVFSKAICLSGTYDLQKKFMKDEMCEDFYYSSPLHFLPNLGDGPALDRLRQRFVLLAHGQGRWEDPQESWRVADVLGKKGVPNRVDEWGEEWDHDWPTWREMMPKYLGELIG